MSYFYFQITKKGYSREVLALNSFHSCLVGSCSLMAPAHFHQTPLLSLTLSSCRAILIFQLNPLHHRLPIFRLVFSPVVTLPALCSVHLSFLHLHPHLLFPSLPLYPKFNPLLRSSGQASVISEGLAHCSYSLIFSQTPHRWGPRSSLSFQRLPFRLLEKTPASSSLWLTRSYLL